MRSLSALDPRHMALQPDDATQKFERLLAKLLVCRKFKADECDGAKRQFDVLLAEVQKYHKEEFEAYTTCQRLDKFFSKPYYNVLWEVGGILLGASFQLCLFHILPPPIVHLPRSSINDIAVILICFCRNCDIATPSFDETSLRDVLSNLNRSWFVLSSFCQHLCSCPIHVCKHLNRHSL